MPPPLAGDRAGNLAQRHRLALARPLADAQLHGRAGQLILVAAAAVIDDLTSGAYEIADLDVDDLRIARGLAAQYRDLKIGITDALNAVLADRYDTNEILTTDQRHFRAVTPLSRRFDAFRLLPADR